MIANVLDGLRSLPSQTIVPNVAHKISWGQSHTEKINTA